jgi:D-glycero-D-manno-heptose 1,7-bisphosphate phosphatase
VNPAVFIDLDGVLIEQPAKPKYITEKKDLKVYPAAVMAVYAFSRSSYIPIVISNKAALAKGELSHEFLSYMTGYVDGRCEAIGGAMRAWMYCPHEDGDDCGCRKPRMGSVQMAAQKYNLDLDRSWLLDNTKENVLAAKKIGMNAMLVEGPLGLWGAARKILPEFYMPGMP